MKYINSYCHVFFPDCIILRPDESNIQKKQPNFIIKLTLLEKMIIFHFRKLY